MAAENVGFCSQLYHQVSGNIETRDLRRRNTIRYRSHMQRQITKAGTPLSDDPYTNDTDAASLYSGGHAAAGIINYDCYIDGSFWGPSEVGALGSISSLPNNTDNPPEMPNLLDDPPDILRQFSSTIQYDPSDHKRHNNDRQAHGSRNKHGRIYHNAIRGGISKATIHRDHPDGRLGGTMNGNTIVKSNVWLDHQQKRISPPPAPPTGGAGFDFHNLFTENLEFVTSLESPHSNLCTPQVTTDLTKFEPVEHGPKLSASHVTEETQIHSGVSTSFREVSEGMARRTPVSVKPLSPESTYDRPSQSAALTPNVSSDPRATHPAAGRREIRPRFSIEEDCRICYYKEAVGLSWKEVSSLLPRSHKALQVHYSNALSPSKSPKLNWTTDMESFLLDVVETHERQMWEVIAKQIQQRFKPNATGLVAPHICCERYHQLLKKERDYEKMMLAKVLASRARS